MADNSLESDSSNLAGSVKSMTNHLSANAKQDISANNTDSCKESTENNHCATKSDEPDGQGEASNKVARPVERLGSSSKGSSNTNEVLPTGTSESQEDAKVDLPPEKGSYYSVGDDESNISLGSMRKDDSGIDVEKTPQKESVEANQSNSEEDKHEFKDSRSHSEKASTSNESEGFVADSSETEESGPSVKTQATKLVAYSDDDDEEEDEIEEMQAFKSVDRSSDDSEDEEDRVAISRKRRRARIQSTSSSSSSSSTTEGADDDDGTKSDKSDEDDATMDVETEPAKDRWHQMPELRKREIGYSNAMYMPQIFARRTCSSLNLVQRLEVLYKMKHHEGCVNALHFNKSGTLLASGSDDLNIVLWNWAVNKPYLVYDSGHRSNVFQAKFMPSLGDCHVVSCARDGMVRLAELSSTGICKNTKKLAQHKGAAHKLAMLEDSSHVFYSCGEDAVTYEMDLRCDKPNKLSTTKENERKIALYSIHSNPFKSFEYCVGGRDHFLRIYDKRMLRDDEDLGPVKKFCPHHLLDGAHKANVTCAVYSYNGTEVLGTYNDEDIYLFDNNHSDGAEHIHRYTGHRNNATVKGVNFYGPESEFIVSGSDCGNVFLWDKDTENVVQYFHADEGGVINVLEPHPHIPVLATSGLDHDVKIWAPTAQQGTSLDTLEQVTRKNRKDRQEERDIEPHMIDGQMLWILMQQLRRTARRRARNEGDDIGSSSSNSDNNDSDDDSEDMPESAQWQCAPS